MSEHRSDSGGTSPAEGRQHEQDKEEFETATGYQPATNQARDEPLPASHHDDSRQEAARRRGEPARDDAPPQGQAPSEQAARGQTEQGQPEQGQAEQGPGNRGGAGQ